MFIGQIHPPEDVNPVPNAGLSPETIAATPKPQGRPRASDTHCVICLDEMSSSASLLVLPCDHYFHETCLSSWLRIRNTCPLCQEIAVNLLEHGAIVGPAALDPSLGMSVGQRIRRFGCRVIRGFLPFSNP